jgi:putative membrane-bound dehydrogenase-like protein
MNFPKFARACTVLAVASLSAVAQENEEFPPAKSPQESLAAIETKPGLRVELVASEPLILDPVAIDWGADGKLWVVEMRDYPMGMDGHWKPGSRIKFLEDTNGDGIYDKATVFLDNLPFATGVTAWGKGALICAAPDITYAEDTNGDGKAEKIERIFSGFETNNYQARVNSLTLGLDNWIYGANGLLGGIIHGQSRPLIAPHSNKPQPIEVDIRGRDFRINPVTGDFEPESGLTQQGRVRDDWGRWFGCDNSTAAWHYPIPDHYLRRNPYVPSASPRVALAGSDLLYPASHALERFNSPQSLNHVTSGCGIGIYRDTLLGDEFYNNAFLCEPVHNLAHRMVLESEGVTFKAVRAPDEQASEFFASRDNWSRPVQMRTGPDGAIWIVDMYRFVIEHPRWIPAERLAKLDPRAGDTMGRIYRVVPEHKKLRKITDLTKLSPAKLAAALETPNGTERDRVHQELVYGRRNLAGDKKVLRTLESLASDSNLPAVRIQALCVLDGLNALRPEAVRRSIHDTNPHVRANALRVSEQLIQRDTNMLWDVAQAASDSNLEVRYQVALTLGEWTNDWAGQTLGKLAVDNMQDEWMRTAILSSAVPHAPQILKAVFASNSTKPERAALISQLIATAAGKGDKQSHEKLIATIAPADSQHVENWHFAALQNILRSLERNNLDLKTVASDDELNKLNLVFDRAEKTATTTNASVTTREAAVRLLGHQPNREAAQLDLLGTFLEPTAPSRLQTAALETLQRSRNAEVATRLLSKWNVLPPSLRQRVIEVLISRDEWTKQLLEALEKRSINRNEIVLTSRQIILKNPNAEIMTAARRVWPENPSSNRPDVLKKYQPALTLNGDAQKGKVVFARTCTQCHRLNNEGVSVGPDLAKLSDKSPADFLLAIIDPNAAVEPRFVAYNIETKDDRSLTGVVSAETATTVSIVQAGGTKEQILRGDIREIRASRLSLMPEGLEQNMTPQDVADLIAYLRGPASSK